jgi:hypothetical protein
MKVPFLWQCAFALLFGMLAAVLVNRLLSGVTVDDLDKFQVWFQSSPVEYLRVVSLSGMVAGAMVFGNLLAWFVDGMQFFLSMFLRKYFEVVSRR